jgi:phage-related protein
VRLHGRKAHVVVAMQIGKRIYVLHALPKKSKKGIETPKRDVQLIKQRYREAEQLEDALDLRRRER